MNSVILQTNRVRLSAEDASTRLDSMKKRSISSALLDHSGMPLAAAELADSSIRNAFVESSSANCT